MYQGSVTLHISSASPGGELERSGVQDLRVQGLRVRVQGSGVRVQGLRVRVQGLGLRVSQVYPESPMALNNWIIGMGFRIGFKVRCPIPF